jgi:hypothetical protein
MSSLHQPELTAMSICRLPTCGSSSWCVIIPLLMRLLFLLLNRTSMYSGQTVKPICASYRSYLDNRPKPTPSAASDQLSPSIPLITPAPMEYRRNDKIVPKQITVSSTTHKPGAMQMELTWDLFHIRMLHFSSKDSLISLS